ncbi:MAG: hypothetical protein QOH90_2069 [Actinomycetota bacterium]|nr:hypothetical protein [Actinomycetota bacterium]
MDTGTEPGGPDAHRLQVQPAENGSAVVLGSRQCPFEAPWQTWPASEKGVANQPMAVPEVLGPPLTGSAVPDWKWSYGRPLRGVDPVRSAALTAG